jgi:hypothetical protein
MKPMFTLHKNAAGEVISANSFRDSYDLSNWIKSLDIRAADRIDFGEIVTRPEFDEVEPLPAFLATQPPAPLVAADEQPF